MKMLLIKSLFAAGVAVAACCAAQAKPVDANPSKWDCCPLSWKFDGTAKTVRARKGPNDLAVLTAAARSAQVTVSARLLPESSGTNGWATMGVAMVDDSRNFWHLALVQAPPELRGSGDGHYFELVEMRDGGWLAHSIDKLPCTKHKVNGTWRYGETYEAVLVSGPSGIRGEIRSADGKTLFSAGFAYPAPAADGSVKAVTCGRPALHANGGFEGVFSSVDAETADPRPLPSVEKRTFPPYESASFVPDVAEKATGFFRVVQRDDGRWWAIDPLGRGTVLLGIDHVKYQGHGSQRTKRRRYLETNQRTFADKKAWSDDTLAKLKSWGFNMLGAGSDMEALSHRGLSHTVFLSMGDSLCNANLPAEYYICPNEHRPCSAFPNVFHPDFEAWCDYCARLKCAPNRDDPWLFGYFIDNELAWWGRGGLSTGLFDAVSSLPDGHSAKAAQREFLAGRGVSGAAKEEDKIAFLKLAAERYFSVASAAIRRYDPNHLVLGARFAGIGGAHAAVWEAAGKYCDLVTFNCYPWADLDRNVVKMSRASSAERADDAFRKLYDAVRKPMMVTEWSFPALDSGLPCTGGAGQRFRTQAERTQASELFARTMLSLPFMAGYDYFMWVDEPPEGISDAFPEDSNYGLVAENGRPYAELTDMFARLHKDAGACRRSPAPAERPAPPPSATYAAAMRASLGTGGGCVREGARFVVLNDAGLSLEGEVGGRRIFDAVKVGGATVGSFNVMLNDLFGAGQRWTDIDKVTAADWRNGVLTVTGQGGGGDRRFELTVSISPVPGKPWFLCELTRARNVGKVPLQVRTFLFRQYAPYAAEMASGNAPKRVPNLWKAPMADAWARPSDGMYFGGLTFAPAATSVYYFVMPGGGQHPDAVFTPSTPLEMAPGASFDPHGSIWFLCMADTQGGFEAWGKLVDDMAKR